MPLTYQDRRLRARARHTPRHPVIAQPERHRDCRHLYLVGCRHEGTLREFVHFRAEHSSLRYRDPVPSRHTIRLQHVDLVSFAAFQIGAFAHVHDEKLRLARSDRSWLEELKQALRKLPADDLFTWQDADLAVSRYHLVNERVGASTLAAQQAKHQLPLRIPARDPSWNESGDLFEWRFESVGLGVDGAACIRHC